MEKALQKLLRDANAKKQAKVDFINRTKDQKQDCDRLHALLDGLRRERSAVTQELEQTRQLKEEKKRQNLEKFKLAEAQKRKDQKKRIEAHKRNQEEIKAQRHFILMRELQYKVGSVFYAFNIWLTIFRQMREKRERQLQDYIRVNLRKVMADQKANERKELEKEQVLEEHAKEARLETLRRQARRRLGVDIVSGDVGPTTATVYVPTKSSTARTKAVEIAQSGIPTEKHIMTPLFKIDTYPEDSIMADSRLVVEKVLREKGLLNTLNTYAAQQILKEVPPPTKPRPDMSSDQVKSILKT